MGRTSPADSALGLTSKFGRAGWRRRYTTHPWTLFRAAYASRCPVTEPARSSLNARATYGSGHFPERLTRHPWRHEAGAAEARSSVSTRSQELSRARDGADGSGAARRETSRGPCKGNAPGSWGSPSGRSRGLYRVRGGCSQTEMPVLLFENNSSSRSSLLGRLGRPANATRARTGGGDRPVDNALDTAARARKGRPAGSTPEA